MKKIILPISQCHTNCPSCRMPSDFQMFESGSSGDFATYLGCRTNNYYRLDLGKIAYLKQELKDLLAPAIATENGTENLSKIPDQIRCKICGTTFKATSIVAQSEDTIEAFEL